MHLLQQFERIRTLADLLEKLKSNPILGYICEFSVLEKTRSTPTIIRFLQNISCNNTLKQFYKIVGKLISLGIVAGIEVVIDAYEKA